jgi:hypothetical protein
MRKVQMTIHKLCAMLGNHRPKETFATQAQWGICTKKPKKNRDSILPPLQLKLMSMFMYKVVLNRVFRQIETTAQENSFANTTPG